MAHALLKLVGPGQIARNTGVAHQHDAQEQHTGSQQHQQRGPDACTSAALLTGCPRTARRRGGLLAFARRRGGWRLVGCGRLCWRCDGSGLARTRRRRCRHILGSWSCRLVYTRLHLRRLSLRNRRLWRLAGRGRLFGSGFPLLLCVQPLPESRACGPRQGGRASRAAILDLHVQVFLWQYLRERSFRRYLWRRSFRRRLRWRDTGRLIRFLAGLAVVGGWPGRPAAPVLR